MADAMVRFPRVRFVGELPQWIIESDKAAYHPYSNTIWLQTGRGRWLVLCSLFKLGHWIGHTLGGRGHPIQVA